MLVFLCVLREHLLEYLWLPGHLTGTLQPTTHVLPGHLTGTLQSTTHIITRVFNRDTTANYTCVTWVFNRLHMLHIQLYLVSSQLLFEDLHVVGNGHCLCLAHLLLCLGHPGSQLLQHVLEAMQLQQSGGQSLAACTWMSRVE